MHWVHIIAPSAFVFCVADARETSSLPFAQWYDEHKRMDCKAYMTWMRTAHPDSAGPSTASDPFSFVSESTSLSEHMSEIR